jgi:hypothetical protein
MAAEFLAPIPAEDDLGQELLSEVLGTPAIPGTLTGRPTLSSDDVRRLPPERFEALIAIFEEQQGARVILTPHAGDGGIDVIAIRGREREVRLIRCKHTLWNASVNADVVAEVIQAFDGYRARRLGAYGNAYVLRAVLVTNGSFTGKARAEGRERDVVLLGNADLDRLLKTVPCTRGDIEAMEGRRMASMRDVQLAIEHIGDHLRYAR